MRTGGQAAGPGPRWLVPGPTLGQEAGRLGVPTASRHRRRLRILADRVSYQGFAMRHADTVPDQEVRPEPPMIRMKGSVRGVSYQIAGQVL